MNANLAAICDWVGMIALVIAVFGIAASRAYKESTGPNARRISDRAGAIALVSLCVSSLVRDLPKALAGDRLRLGLMAVGGFALSALIISFLWKTLRPNQSPPSGQGTHA